jgi:DNA-binding protein H-NS
MSAKKIELEPMSLDELWALHEEISAILSTRITAEKHELEKRLAVLGGGVTVGKSGDLRPGQAGKARRKYPRVLPKYRNPQTSMKSGHKIEEFQIGQGGSKGRRRA